MRVSKFRIFSIGIVIGRSKKGSKGLIKVYPVEILPEMDGELLEVEETITGEGVNGTGETYSASAKVGNYITAQWLSLSTNRVTPPDVLKGEQVLLWVYADEDKYYWTSMGRDDNLRRLENVVYAYSDISDPESNEPLTIDNCYTVMVSTRDKHVSVKTVKEDGEPFEYLLQLNTKNGKLIVKDDVGNHITMCSDKETIECGNKSKSIVTLAASNVTICSPNDISLNAKNNFNLKAGRDISLSAGGNVSITSGRSATFKVGTAYNLNISGDASVTASTYRLNSSGSVNIQGGARTSISGGSIASLSAPSVTIQGGSVSVAGGGLRGSGGGSQFSGNVNFIDRVTFRGASLFSGDAAFSKDVVFDAGATFGGDVKGTKFYGDFYGTLYGNTVP